MPIQVVMTRRHLRELVDAQPILRDIFMDIAAWYSKLGAKEIRVTSVHRTDEENEAAQAKTKIHVVGPPYRALDVSVWSLGLNFEGAIKEVAEVINGRYQYDPKRPGKYKVVYARPHGTGPHIHVQVHGNTRRRDGLAD